VEFEADSQTLIVAGDLELVTATLEALRRRDDELTNGTTTSSEGAVDAAAPVLAAPTSDTLDLAILNPSKPLPTASSVLEFLLLALC
jgi:hypothetical protein